ncbi:MAG TPA: 2-amino-4-hydroxy-6-hydroxymethyldihydropteridine diphosphokinase [Chthoniobacterales bacterium]|jgi:2-amino-4-hydroxy-6-hydroxymethyldihydropteridine diphosphokinase
MSSSHRIGIALGANLGDRLRSLTTARKHIFGLPKVIPPFLSSRVYETDPVECETGAERFLNAAIEIGYEDSPEQLLSQLQKIEAALGRPADHRRNHSRPIDLDLLYFGACQIDEPGLQLPHPRLHLRGFVLCPLAEIRPHLVLPGQSQTVSELRAELTNRSSVVRASEQW